MKKVAVIGSGPAGLSGALALRESGCTPVIFERRDRLSLKLLASGGGRCNFSNTLPPEAFMKAFGRHGAFMRNALTAASQQWLAGFLKKCGIDTAETEDGCLFPASGTAAAVRDAFLQCAMPEIHTSSEVTGIITGDNGVCGITAGGREFAFDAVILAGGSPAWKGLGTDAGLALASGLGHRIATPLPAMAPLIIQEAWVHALAGVSLAESTLAAGRGREKAAESGTLLFTHDGLSGLAAINISGAVSSLCAAYGVTEVTLSLCGGMSRGDWQSVLDKARASEGSRLVGSVLGRFLPRRLADTVCGLSGCADCRCAVLGAGQREKLLDNLTSVKLTASGAGPMERAMAMRGGVSLKEIDPATMESRIVPGLFLAGEIVDIVGPCGGFNIQWAFSSGRLAGLSAAQRL